MSIAISVIVPTYNRPESVLRLIERLERQRLDHRAFELIVVDDGSNMDMATVARACPRFRYRLHRQSNQGEVVARNRGVELAEGELVVFLDDDIEVAPGYLEALRAAHQSHPRCVIMAALETPEPEHPSPFARWVAEAERRQRGGAVSFLECYSGILSVSREGYGEIGGMRALDAAGRNPWGGIDFGYRAQGLGYGFRRAAEARAIHHDFAVRDLDTYSQRWEGVAAASPRLFRRYPELRDALPMLRDKQSPRWTQDSPRLLLRKLLRRISASAPMLACLQGSVRLIARWSPDRRVVLGLLYRWIVGAHVYRGVRTGEAEIARRG